MKFAVILRESGIPTQDFKKSAEIPITLYDEDDWIDNNDDVQYQKKLFENNTKSLLNFYDFLKELENQPTPKSMNVMIGEHNVVLFYKTPHARSFSRTEPMNPMDFMD